MSTPEDWMKPASHGGYVTGPCCPACEVIGTVTVHPSEEGAVTWKLWELSCGHEATTHDEGCTGDCPRPSWCPECGARIAGDAE